jgi:LacI family transcriptional regulator
MAWGVYTAAAELGLSIPDDLSIIGFDDQAPIPESLFPRLTTVALPHYEMGAWAVETLLSLIEGSPDTWYLATHPTLMKCPIIERESVARPAS